MKIEEILNDNETDLYYKTKNTIKSIIRCNEDICNCFETIKELNDFIRDTKMNKYEKAINRKFKLIKCKNSNTYKLNIIS